MIGATDEHIVLSNLDQGTIQAGEIRFACKVLKQR